MTVKELMNILKDYDDSLDICFKYVSTGTGYNIVKEYMPNDVQKVTVVKDILLLETLNV